MDSFDQLAKLSHACFLLKSVQLNAEGHLLGQIETLIDQLETACIDLVSDMRPGAT
jgi:hypothetical protein